MSVRDIFPIKIYETEFENFVEIQQDLRNKIKPLFETNTASGNDYFDKDGQPIFARTNPNIQNNPDLQILKDFINHHVKLYWQACNYTSKVDPYVMQMWANDVPPGGFTPAHNHNPVPIAGVFYIDADEHQGNLYLEDPLEIVKGKMPYDFSEKPYLYTETITVKPGKLVLFPGWLRHHVRSNRANENRIVIGLNAGAFVEFKSEP